MRTYSAQTPDNIDKEVELAGWVDGRRDHGKLIFIDLRDRDGLVQLVFNEKKKDVYELADSLRPEWVIRVKGRVSLRPESMKNPELKTGKIEIPVEELEIISKAETPPFGIDSDGYEVNEEIRMKHRYVDLRRRRLQKNLKKRNEVIKFMRDFLARKGFIEIETPIISKSTPEGARDYLVPSRQHPGKFYALPQSPQQYKQLLMVAGFERYFQIARCFRDEDTRGDRQPEFTQLDIEMSFVDEDDVLDLVEELFLNLVRNIYPEKTVKLDKDGHIPRISHEGAVKEYKSDRPDLRDNPDDESELAPAFIIDFPMFEKRDDSSTGSGLAWTTSHHPFTMPVSESVEDFKKQFKKDPASIKARQYDMVLNGWEVFGGSIRIHDPEMLVAVFEAIGHEREEVEAKFGHLLEAFRYGVPPHGGIASGLDRLIAVLENEPNIREVIAFPKTGDGRDLMMESPSEVDKEQLNELGLELKKNDK